MSKSYSSLADFPTIPGLHRVFAVSQSWLHRAAARPPSFSFVAFIFSCYQILTGLTSSSALCHLFSLIVWFFLASMKSYLFSDWLRFFPLQLDCMLLSGMVITSIVVTIFNILNCSPREGHCAKQFTCINPWGTIIAPFSQVRKTEEQRQCIIYLKSHTHPGRTWWGQASSPGRITTLFAVRGP